MFGHFSPAPVKIDHPVRIQWTNQVKALQWKSTLDWLIYSTVGKNCPTGMISGWIQKVTEHRGTTQYTEIIEKSDDIQNTDHIFFSILLRCVLMGFDEFWWVLMGFDEFSWVWYGMNIWFNQCEPERGTSLTEYEEDHVRHQKRAYNKAKVFSLGWQRAKVPIVKMVLNTRTNVPESYDFQRKHFLMLRKVI